MPVPSRRLKDLIEGTVDHHASQRWPALEEVTITWRGSYGYLTGYLSDNDDDTIHECWMGSRLARPAGDEAAVRVTLRGPMVTDGASGSITAVLSLSLSCCMRVPRIKVASRSRGALHRFLSLKRLS